jgi:protein-S-isoprenylcysteine O-methyltransferase Ste14
MAAARKPGAAAGSVVFFVANLGLMGGIVPWLLTQWRSSQPPQAWEVLGGVLIVTGVGLLLDTIARFVREGQGTPHPLAPTEQLVVGGPYRHVRNPMYLAVIVASFVRLHEEPALRDRYGERYATYQRAVPGWWPRRHPWPPEPSDNAE